MFHVKLVGLLLINFIYSCKAPEFVNNACKRYQDYPLWFISKNCYFNPDVLSDPPSIIRRNGYNFRGYTVTTEDDYLLTLYRIPPEKNDFRKQKQPIFIQHGLLTNSAIWINKGNKSLGFYLANLGYDVWLGNIRGSTFSRGHKVLKIDDYKYWDFNLDHIAKYDISAKLRFIANKTGMGGSIIYLGHSMGTTLAFMYASSKVEEAHSLLHGIIAMAPTVYFDNVAVVKRFEYAAPRLQKVLERHKIGGLFHQKSLRYLSTYVCMLNPFICKKILEVTFGNLTGQFLPEHLLLFFGNFPCASSVGQLLHFRQLAKLGKFTSFDYGNEGNLYSYELSKIKLPVFLFYGKNDVISTIPNVRRVFNELGTSRKFMQIIPVNNEKNAFNHLNFMVGKDIVEFLFIELEKTLIKELNIT